VSDFDLLLGVLRDPANAGELSPAARSALLAQIAAVLVALAAGSDAAMQTPPEAEGTDRLLSVPKAAARLGFKPEYLYDLIRRRQFPAVHVGKYVRVRLSDLESLVRTGSVDRALYTVYGAGDGRARTASAQKAGKIDAAGARRQARRHREHGGPLGTRRGHDLGADGSVDRDDTDTET